MEDDTRHSSDWLRKQYSSSELFEAIKLQYFMLGLECAARVCDRKIKTILECSAHNNIDQLTEFEQAEVEALDDLRTTISTVIEHGDSPSFLKDYVPDLTKEYDSENP